MAKVLIVGSNRGIGLELVRQFAARGDSVWAACRKASDGLKDVKNVTIVENIDIAKVDWKTFKCFMSKIRTKLLSRLKVTPPFLTPLMLLLQMLESSIENRLTIFHAQKESLTNSILMPLVLFA